MRLKHRLNTSIILFILSILFLIFGYCLWSNWPVLIMKTMHWQKEINTQLSELLYEAQTNPLEAGLTLMGLSFIYGVIHSIGPGHGKMIVSTYILTHQTKVKISLILTILSALLQAIVAVVLVSVLLKLFNSSMHEVNIEAKHFVEISFYVLIFLGTLIVKGSLSQFYNIIKTDNKTAYLTNRSTEDSSSSCDHKHFIDPEAVNKASSIKDHLLIIISIGMRPCTGAILVLLFANMLHIYWLGVVSAFIMAIGTALTTSLIAILALSGKQLVKRYIGGNDPDSKGANIYLAGSLLKLIGGGLLILMGVILLSSNQGGMLSIF